ncbi:hypothetical protein JHK82_056609 [Glycine max]|uniref:Uncharacterized protein n=1 Tax=Glycine max TaxID=3847 RepID=A0A0R0EKR1_SOYBN|nr:hypothetical protein JHK86_056442 [Glycine max]KAG4910590.1 hypothetical protein JHK87_056706 [Glycine soja]KAG4919168.1 hypothetical protein JHK85_057449 [Glycine max]KAG5075249.1 hypothetical protein JHK84_056480 [Glycine max]KAG5077914.1 hypothetical protein JHK82_056609 [Glycine max]
MWFSIPIEVSRRMGCRQDSSRLSRLFGSLLVVKRGLRGKKKNDPGRWVSDLVTGSKAKIASTIPCLADLRICETVVSFVAKLDE